jgi:polyisoprenoid-binding protein YceI
MFRALALAALCAAPLAACSKDPAADAPKAAVTEVKAPASAAAAPATEPPAAATAEALRIAPETSKIGFVGSKVTASHEGGFAKFEGMIDLVDARPEVSRVRIDIDTASVQIDPPKLTEHLKSPDFFDVAQYPKATFVSTAIRPGADGAPHTVTGDFELHGVKKQITFPATIAVDAGAVTAKAEFAINRKDFGIVYPGMADDLIRDDVVIKLDISAPRGK